MCICREKCKKGCLPVCEEWYFWVVISWMGFPSGQAVKNPLDSSVPGWGRFPGEGNGNPLQCSCPGNPMDRGARAGYSPWGCNSMGYDLATQQQPWVTDILFVNEHCNFSTKNVYYIYLKNNKIVKKSDFVKCINTRLTYIKMSNRSVFSHSRPSPTCPPSGPPPHPLCVHCSAMWPLLCFVLVRVLSLSLATTLRWKVSRWWQAPALMLYQLWLIYLYHRIVFGSFPLHVFSSRKATSPSGQGQLHYISGFPSWAPHGTCHR